MKAQVTFYSALAFLLDLVASIPYAVDLQRYSSQHQAIPSLEVPYPQRPYKHFEQQAYDGGYNKAPQFHEQELPRINQDNYFVKPQQLYLNKRPPPIQPELSNERYINHQNTLNQQVVQNFQEALHRDRNNNWRGGNLQTNENQVVQSGNPEDSVRERDTPYRNYQQQVIQNNRFAESYKNEVRETSNQRLNLNPILNYNRELIGNGSPQQEKLLLQKLLNNPLTIDNIPQLHNAPEKFTEESFSPSIPSVPIRNVDSSNDALFKVNDHYLHVEPVVEYKIPVVPPTPNHVAHGIPLSASERYLARAGNPVERIPESQPPKYNVSTDSRIRNILSTNKHKKRYLVIHPNGTIEHVDTIETIAKEHPHYILVNGGDITPSSATKENAGIPSLVPPPPKTVQENVKTPNEQANFENKTTVPSTSYEPSSPVKINVIVKNNSTHVPENVTIPATTVPTTAPILVAPTISAIAQTATKPITSTPKAKAVTNATQAAAVLSGPQAVAIASAPQSEAIASAQKAKAPLPTPQALPSPSTSPAQSSNSSNSTSKAQTVAPISQTPSLSSSKPKPVQQSDIKIYKEVLPLRLKNETDKEVKQQQNVPKVTSTVVPETRPINASVALPTSPTNPQKTKQNSIPNTETAKPLTPNIVKVATTSLPATQSTAAPVKTATTVVEIENKRKEATNSTKTPPDNLNETDNKSPQSIDQFIVDVASNNNGDSNAVANVPQNPVVWFRTSDPNFWSKLTDKKTAFDVVYFFQVHNTPKIVNDTKTTIFPNGTVLQEFTETSYAFEGAEPIIKKTTKLTNPKDL